MSKWKEFSPEDVPADWLEAAVFLSRACDHVRYNNSRNWTNDGLDAFYILNDAQHRVNNIDEVAA